MNEPKKNIVSVEDVEIRLLLDGVFRVYGYDFRDFEPSLVRQRIRESMLAGRVPTISRLQDKLLHDPVAFRGFLRRFSRTGLELFSDPEFYRVFRSKLVPTLKTYPFIRIWQIGCSTGEDIYSLAILLQEEGIYERSRFYATDLSDMVLESARSGSVPVAIMEGSAMNYKEAGGTGSLWDYFKKRRKMAILDPALRKNMLFSEHNPATDGSFNEFQVIVCRDILSTLNTALRDRVEHLILLSLSRFGVLALGREESTASMILESRYSVLDEPNRFLQKVGTAVSQVHAF